MQKDTKLHFLGKWGGGSKKHGQHFSIREIIICAGFKYLPPLVESVYRDLYNNSMANIMQYLILSFTIVSI